MRKSVIALASCTMVVPLFAATIPRAMPIPPQPIPVSRLVNSLSERIAKNPDDVQAIFTLGRVHYFAFSGATDVVNITSRADSLTLYDFFGERGKGMAARGKATKPLSGAERLAHLKNALVYLKRAVSMKKPGPLVEDGRYELSLACAFEEGAPFASAVGPIADIPLEPAGWLDAAIVNYGLAFDRAAEGDSQRKSQPMWGLSTLVSYGAALSYNRLVGARGVTLTAAEKSRLDRMGLFIAAMNSLPPPGIITPLIFSTERRATLAELLSRHAVDFNLSGSNLPQRYGWVQPNTAILVWDPMGSGRITSGRQLFGSVTWWMFWDDAYQALDVLDDDRNGWVEGPELVGLALWFDRNQDGRSDPGEVVPIEATQIVAIATQTTGRTGSAQMNSAGLRLRDGTLLPTYDWIATPVLDRPDGVHVIGAAHVGGF